MIKTKNKISIALIITVLMTAIAALAIFGGASVSSAQTPAPTEVYAPQNVVLGTEFTMPSREFELGGEKKTVTATLISPSGLGYDASVMTLDEVGEWTVRFAPVFDKVYLIDYKFTVWRNTYEVTNGGTVSFGVNPLFPKLNDAVTTNDGLILSIPKGGEFRYNDKINLSSLTASDTLITLGLLPVSVGSADVSTVDVVLTDIYDADNKVIIEFTNPNNNDAGAYQGCGTVGATFTGAGVKLGIDALRGSQSDPSSLRAHYWAGSQYYGAYTPFSFDGQQFKSTTQPVPMSSLAFDYASKEVHCKTKLWGGEAASGTKYSTLVAELAKTDYSDSIISGLGRGFERAFGGFTTGEVYLSISAHGYSGSECGVFVREIYGADLGQEESFDHERPIIKVDTDGYDRDDLPVAEVNKAYKIFDATAVDNITSPLFVTTEVFFMRGNTRMYNVPVVNGTFTPTVAGKYVISYSASDGSGYSVTDSLYVTAYESVGIPEIEFGDYDATGIAGEKLQIANYTAVSHSGRATVSVKAVCGNEWVTVYGDGEYIMPEKTGTYLILFNVSDYIGKNIEYSYSVTVSADKNPVVSAEPLLPPGFISGMTYTLPSAVAYDYYTTPGEKKEVRAAIEVIDSVGTHTLTDGVYAPSSGADETVTVNYKFTSASGETVYTKQLPSVAVKDYATDLKKYFVGGTAAQQQDGMSLVFDGNKEITYIKAVPSSQSTNTLKLGSSVSGDKVDIFFRDAEEDNKIVKVSFTASANTVGGWDVSVNDGEKRAVSLIENGIYSFTFASERKTVSVGSATLRFEKTLDGEPFDGMSNHRAYVSIESTKDIEILMLSGFSFAARTDDYSRPVLTADGEVESSYDLNEQVTVFKAFATDMLRENVTVTVTVILPSGGTMVSTDGVTLQNVSASRDYSVVLSEYGRYTVRYTARTDNGYSATMNVTLYAPDNVAPEITLSEGSFACTVNASVALPAATVSDNCTAADKISVSVMYTDPDGRSFLIKTAVGSCLQSDFTFDKIGRWTIAYVAYDEFYNTSFESITVEVRAKL